MWVAVARHNFKWWKFTENNLVGKGITQDKNQVKFINISTQHIIQCNQSEPLADASRMIVDLINENGVELVA